MQIHRLAAILCLIHAIPSSAEEPGDALEAGFRRPPDSARPHTWWHWMNGNITKEGITADLEAMKRVGVGGAQIFNVDCGIPAGPVRFLSPEWKEMTAHAIREAARVGVGLSVHNCAGWSSSGGPWVRPEQAMQTVVVKEVPVRGPAAFAEVLPRPEARAGHYRDIAVLAFPTPAGGAAPAIEDLPAKTAQVRGDPPPSDARDRAGAGAAVPRDRITDLTGRLGGDGRLAWDVPPGDWTILRVGHTPTGATNRPAPPEGAGLEVDKMSREAMDAFFREGMMAAVLEAAGPLAGTALRDALIDSYEVESQNWTPRFREEFRARRGYDLLPLLPAFAGRVVDSPAVTERFLWDLRRTVADLYAENYYGRFAELCRERGLTFSVEPYGNGPFDDLQVGGLADIVMGEFWAGGVMDGSSKVAASAAHTHGRRIVGAEAFTAAPERGRWTNTPASLKVSGDLAFCAGINRLIFHRWAHQPWTDRFPGMTMGPWGFHFERTNTWFEQSAAWLDYLARCQFLLQEGRYAADVCYFAGEGAPTTVRDGGPPPPGEPPRRGPPPRGATRR